MKTLGLKNVNVCFYTGDGKFLEQINMEWILEDAYIVDEYGDLTEEWADDPPSKEEIIKILVEGMAEQVAEDYPKLIKRLNKEEGK